MPSTLDWAWWIILAVSAGFVLLRVARRPGTLCPTLVAVSVGTAGLMIKGYAIVDELLAAITVAAGLMAVSVHGVPARRRPHNSLHLMMFLTFVAYMVVQTVRSPLLPEDVRVFRWIAFYAMLGVIALIISIAEFPIPSPHRMAPLVVWPVLLYLGAYLLHGVVSEQVRGVSRWALQGVEWSGSAYAMFPAAMALPAGFSLLGRDQRRVRALGWAFLVAMIVTALYYQSRIALLALAGFLVVSPLLIGVRRSLALSAVTLFAVMVTSWTVYFGTVDSRSLPRLGTTLYQASSALWAPGENDLDRNLQLRAALRVSTDGAQNLLFGGGLYSHRSALPPVLQDLFDASLPGTMVADVLRTTGLSALLVDAGAVGLLLVGANAVLAVRSTLVGARTGWGIMSGASIAVLAVSWLLVSNILDIVLFYVVIMPRGLTAFLGALPVPPQGG